MSIDFPDKGSDRITRIPHAGREGVPDDTAERPVHEFDATSLEDAVSQGLVDDVPESAGLIVMSEAERTRYEAWKDSQRELPTESKKSLPVRIGAVAATLVVGFGALVAYKSSSQDDTEVLSPTQPVAEAPAVIPPAMEAVPPSEAPAPEASPATGSGETIPEAVAALEQTSIAGFEKLPLADKLLYYSYLTRNREERTQSRFKLTGDKRELIVEAGETNSGQEVLNYLAYNLEQAYADRSEERADGGVYLDKDAAIKSLGGVYYQTGGVGGYSPIYSADKDALLQSEAARRISTVYTFVSERPFNNAYTADSKVYDGRDITAKNEDGLTFTFRVALIDYIDYQGNPEKTWVILNKFSN